MPFPNNQSNAGGAIPVYLAGQRTGGNATGSVDNTGTQQVIAAGVYSGWVTITNTHATNAMNISFTNPATVNDQPIPPGGSFTFPFGLKNALYGIGNGGTATFSTIGW
jgi:hypothetical protein